jgi:type IV secretory pathway VirB4 component
MQLNNPNSFIFGMPGSGKSMLAKLMILYIYLSQNDEILIVDPDREYAALVELLGGEVIYMSENSGTHINPLDLTENPDSDDREYDPVKAKLDFMLSFFSAIMGDCEITPIQKTIIDSVMHTAYRNYAKPTLREYYAELQAYEQNADEETRAAAAFLRQTLYLYVHGSMNVFAHETNVNIQKRIVAYDIKELGKNMQTLSMMIVLENIWNRVAQNRARGIRTQIFVDEMYLLFKSEQSANFFFELYKRARKWGGVPCGITQNVDDLLRSERARTMISNTQFVVMLAQNQTDREQLANLLHIPQETMDTFLSSAGSGSGLIYAGDFGLIPFDNTFPTDTEIYSIATTKFNEVQHE